MDPAKHVVLFISAASADFRAERKALAARLHGARVTAKVQEDFIPHGEQTLAELDVYVRGCDFVVHLLGPSAGDKPAPSSVAAFRATHQDRLAQGDWLAQILSSPNAEHFSYTQWEAYLALLHGKRLLIYAPQKRYDALMALKAAQADAATPPATSPGGQDAHALRLMAHDWFPKPFDGVDHVANLVSLAVADVYIAKDLPPPRLIDTSHLPPTYAARLFGRDEEMARLDAVWAADERRVFAFDAMGGAGKTALIRHFTDRLSADGWRGADAVFAWSFYSQGSNEDRQTSAQEFFNAAFAFFGATPPTEPGKKGPALAALAAQRRTLFILDGLEPLQYTAGGRGGAVSQVIGGIKDPDVKALLTQMLDAPTGLTLVTTRIPMSDFTGRARFDREALDQLPLMAAIALLRHLGVATLDTQACPPADFAMPSRAALEAYAATLPEQKREPVPPAYDADAAQETAPGLPVMPANVAYDLAQGAATLDGHALALTLAGNFLATHKNGDPRAIHELPPLASTGKDRNPFRVMRAIELALVRQIISQNLKNGRAPLHDPANIQAGKMLGLLAFLGFFDRPAERRLLDVVFDRKDAPEPEPDDVAIADDPATLPRILDLQDEMRELERQRAAGDLTEERFNLALGGVKPEHDRLTRAQRRVAFRRVFARIRDFSEEQITTALSVLADQGLVQNPREQGGRYKASAIDCHPLVREYFGQRLGAAETAEEPGLDRGLFQAAHGRLYDHYRYAGLPEAFREPVAYGVLALAAAFPYAPFQQDVLRLAEGDLPKQVLQTWPPSLHNASPEQLRAAAGLIDTADWEEGKRVFLPEDEAGMTPLFAAIAHGCAAGREDECFNEVYWPRVARGNEGFAAKKLGLYGQELAALAAFFDSPFSTPSPRLSDARQALALNSAAFQLRALGRLADAVAPFGADTVMYIEQRNWKGAAIGAGNLSELLLVLGRLGGAATELANVDWTSDATPGAVAVGAAAVAYADQSGDAFQRMARRTILAEALARAGQAAAAEALFRRAEVLQAERQPDLPRLYSLQGYQYADLLLARGRAAEAGERAAWAIDVAIQNSWLLDIGLDTLTQARAALALWDGADPAALRARFDAALDALRKANNEDYLPRGLLARAEACLALDDAEDAGKMLREAEDTARRGPMPLFLADTHLLWARLNLAAGRLAHAKTRRDQAAELIVKHDYGHAQPRLALLDLALAHATGADIAEAADTALRAVAGDHPTLADTPPLPDDVRLEEGGGEGWWGLLPELERLLADHPAYADRLELLRTRRDLYNTKRDAYLAEEERKQSTKDKAVDPDDIPESVVDQFFDDPRAEPLIEKVMQANDLSGDPKALPLGAKRAIMAVLAQNGDISLGGAGPQKPPQSSDPTDPTVATPPQDDGRTGVMGALLQPAAAIHANGAQPPWTTLDGPEKAALLEAVAPLEDGLDTTPSRTNLAAAPLPWADNLVLLRLTNPTWPTASLVVYFLFLQGSGESAHARLDGQSGPIHELNAKANLVITEANVLDYLEFFCFFVRGDEGPFFIWERLDHPLAPPVSEALHAKIRETLGPTVYKGRDAAGQFLCDAKVLYSNAIFQAQFAVHPSGMMEMLEDEAILAELPFRLDQPLTYKGAPPPPSAPTPPAKRRRWWPFGDKAD